MGLISGLSKYSTMILLAALAAALVWGGALMLTNDRLQVEIKMYQEQVSNAKTIDEMNKNTAIANQLVLQAVIDKQNQMFAGLSELSNENSNTILVRLKEQQAAQASQYSKVTQAINGIQIDTCQGLIDALIQFPSTGVTTWEPITK